jgi:penicillin-insensitive murein endopeptidase
VAWGFVSGGALLDGVRLPREGDGYVIPATWWQRGNNWGTEELVGLIVRAARRVATESPGAVLSVADLSPRRGGPSAWHRSHQTGSDADLIFFMRDEQGKPVKNPRMWRLADDGTAELAGKKSSVLVTLDVERQWLLVRALLEDPLVDVQYLFISEGLKALLIEHAEAIGEPEDLLVRARAVLHQPRGGALPHDDHLHLRIYCPAGDRVLGCRDKGPLRWFKKSYKYLEARKLVPPEKSPPALWSAFCQIGPPAARTAGR